MKTAIAGLVCVVFLSVSPAKSAVETVAGAVKSQVTDSDRAASQDHYLKGLNYFQAGVYKQAGVEWETALRLDPENSDAKAGLERLKKLLPELEDNGLSAPKKKTRAASGAGAAAESAAAPVKSAPGGEFLDEKVEYGGFQASTETAESPYVGLVPGYRGTAIPVSGDQLLYVKKGDRVDVLVTFDAAAKDVKEKVTATILQNVIVINVRKPDHPDETGVIELLCNPNEAQYLALSAAQGDTSIAVRAPGDFSMRPMEMASFRKLIK
ncbi:MAG: hypothetical protein KKH28_14275 [Elusimicrobia bacterium]|nr:hypothetical protein [Elusimicrobiota bacterium]